MFFFFNYKHYPTVAVTVVEGHAGTSPTESADYVRPVVQWVSKKKKRRVYIPTTEYRRYPVKNVTLVEIKTPVQKQLPTISLAPKVAKALSYIDKPIEYENKTFTSSISAFEKGVFFKDVIYVPPKKEAPQKSTSEVKISKAVPDKTFVNAIDKIIKELERQKHIKELEEYVLRLQEHKKRLKEEAHKKEVEEIEDIASALMAAGEEDLAAVLFTLH